MLHLALASLSSLSRTETLVASRGADEYQYAETSGASVNRVELRLECLRNEGQMHEMEKPCEVTLALRFQGDIACIWSGAVPAGHSHGAAHVCAGDKRRPLQPSHLPPVQGANAGQRLCTNITCMSFSCLAARLWHSGHPLHIPMHDTAPCVGSIVFP